LQPIHEKYLSDQELFVDASQFITAPVVGDILSVIFKSDYPRSIEGGVNILDYESRISYGCKLLGYSEKQGCKP
ncbi:hypothetical protein, partial [Oligella sp. HMSC05A10]